MVTRVAELLCIISNGIKLKEPARMRAPAPVFSIFSPFIPPWAGLELVGHGLELGLDGREILPGADARVEVLDRVGTERLLRGTDGLDELDFLLELGDLLDHLSALRVAVRRHRAGRGDSGLDRGLRGGQGCQPLALGALLGCLLGRPGGSGLLGLASSGSRGCARLPAGEPHLLRLRGLLVLPGLGRGLDTLGVEVVELGGTGLAVLDLLLGAHHGVIRDARLVQVVGCQIDGLVVRHETTRVGAEQLRVLAVNRGRLGLVLNLLQHFRDRLLDRLLAGLGCDRDPGRSGHRGAVLPFAFAPFVAGFSSAVSSSVLVWRSFRRRVSLVWPALFMSGSAVASTCAFKMLTLSVRFFTSSLSALIRSFSPVGPSSSSGSLPASQREQVL